MRGSKTGLLGNRRAQGPHAPPAIAGRRIASRHHAKWCRLASANYFPTERVFEARPPVFGGGARVAGCSWERQGLGSMPPEPMTLLALSHRGRGGEMPCKVGLSAALGYGRQAVQPATSERGICDMGAVGKSMLGRSTASACHARVPDDQRSHGSDFSPQARARPRTRRTYAAACPATASTAPRHARPAAFRR